MGRQAAESRIDVEGHRVFRQLTPNEIRGNPERHFSAGRAELQKGLRERELFRLQAGFAWAALTIAIGCREFDLSSVPCARSVREDLSPLPPATPSTSY